MACVARASAPELCFAAAAACCAANVAASDAKLGAEVTAALPGCRAWATGIASASVSRLVPASKPPRDSDRAGCGIDRCFCGARTSREKLGRRD
jgi:hypothetical protein